MDSMYEFLMELPLFKGVGFDKISEIIGTTKFHFLKYLEGETIVSAGDPCTHIRFVISGSARQQRFPHARVSDSYRPRRDSSRFPFRKIH